MDTFGKWALPYTVAFGVGFYTTFVLQSLWNWFAVPALNVSSLSYWATYGLNMVIACFKGTVSPESVTNDHRWKIAITVLQECIPPDKEEHVREELTILHHGQAGELWKIAITQFGVQTFALAVGWFIHTFLV